MKRALWVFFAGSLTTASIAQDVGHDSFVSASRSAHETVWQRVEWITNQLGEAVAQTNEFVEVATGLNHLSDETPPEWQPSREEWEVYPDAVVARAGQHKVILAHNLNLAGAVDVLTPDGQRLISSPVSFGFYDPVDGKQVVLAEVKDCKAERGATPNEIVFRECFDRIRGSIRFFYTKAGVHQHVVLEQKLELPEGFSDKSRLECYTVFDAATPWPQITTRVLRREKDPVLRAQMVEPDFTDSEIAFGGAMAMRAGKAFSLGDETEARSIRVGKQFVEIEGLPVLIEGVEFKPLEPLLARLAAVERTTTSGLAVNTSRQIKRAKEQARLPREHFRAVNKGKEIQLASRPLNQPAVVVDYELLNSSTNLSLKGDTTFFVSGSVNLSGTTRIEGGVVVKFTNSLSAKLNVSGTIACETGPYRPAIFTTKDDDSVGQTIVGSSGNPTNLYGSGIALTTSGNTLTNVRFSYLYEALSYDSGGSSGEVNVGNAQFVNCRYALSAEQSMCFVNCGATINLDNALVSGCDTLFSGDFGILRARHLTANRCNWLGDDKGGDSAIYLTNSLLVAVTNWGNMPYTTNATRYYATDPGGIFQTVGAGAHYLVNGSTNRDIGTTNLAANLLAALKKKTTYAPVLLSNVTITVSTNLLPQAQRDTDLPDLGFHYDPLDFIVAQCIVTNATLNLSNGVAIGYYNQAAGIWLQDNTAINSVGLPVSPNWFAHYTLVQEQPVYLGDVALSSALAVNPYHYGNTGPNGLYRFTHFASPGGAYLLVHSAEWAYSNLWVQDCQLWNGWNYLEGTTNSVAVLKNNLFERSSLSAYGTAGNTLTLSNNLVRNTEVWLQNLPSVNLWRIHDNAFDHCVVAYSYTPLTNSHNAYISCWGRFTPTNVNDVVLTNFTYTTGPLGDYYHISTNLLDAGSVTNAGVVGLYHYTTLTNQTKEASSRLDIGFHYVSVDSSGEPADTDHGGVPDYLEDANGNGTVNTGETDWLGNAADDDVAGVYGSVLVPRYLRCEYRQNPLGVETNYGPPRLYWIVTSNRRAQKQTSYRLLVASSEANLNLNYGDMWDSREVPSDQTLHVEYKGNALASGQRLWWKVRSWDAWGSPSPWSTNAFFQMGLLSTNDWTGAKWIGVNGYQTTKPVPMFRSPLIVLTNQVARATVYASAKGVYELWINGYRIGPNILAPEWTDYNRRIQYQTYDVTAYLTNGTSTAANVMGAFVGEGWCYGETDGNWNVYPNYYGTPSPQFLLRLSITNLDGSTTNYFTDSNWLCSTNGPIRFASIYDGETYDARAEGATTNWCTAAYTPLYFTNSMSVSNVATNMFAQLNDPIQITQYIQPIDKWTFSSNATQMKIVYDLGQNISGWCILSLTNVANLTNTSVTLLHGEALNVDTNNNGAFGLNNKTNIYRKNLGADSGSKDAKQEDQYLLNADANQQFHPHFTYHGFRYVEIWAPPAVATNLSLNSITGCVIHSSVPISSKFWCSDARACSYVTNLVSKLVTNASWSLRANLQGVFTAVPQRPEREGYLFDPGIFSQSACFYADMAGFLTKWIRDIRDAQDWRQSLTGDGAYTVIAPNDGLLSASFSDIGAQVGGLLFPWRMYQNYGDTRVLAQHFASVTNQIRYLTNLCLTADGSWRTTVWTTANIAYGDWGNGDGFDIQWPTQPDPHPYYWPKDADVGKPTHGTALSAYSLDTAASIALALQLDAIARNDTAGANFYSGYYSSFTSFAAKARTAYTNASNGLVQYDGSGAITRVGAKSSQSDCMTALYFDMIPSSQRLNVINLLLNATNLGIVNYNVRYTNDGYNPVYCTNHLSSGYVYAAREMLELSRNGYTGKAYELLMDTNFPSWLYAVVNGTTTIWEDWNTYLSGPAHPDIKQKYAGHQDQTLANDRGHYRPNSHPWIPNTSYNCLALGAVAEWIWKVIGGINPDDANPGFKNVFIKPEPGGGLTNAVASVNSIRGPINISWTNNVTSTNYTLNVTVPPNATASIYIPSTNLVNITESGTSATSAPGVQSYYFTNWPNWSGGATVFQVGAGVYQFKASGVTF